MKTVVSLCDRSGRMVRPWALEGYECWCVDIAQDSPRTETVGRGRIHYVRADVTKDGWHRDLPRTSHAVFAFPPCTDLAASGARWWRAKGNRVFVEAVALADACRNFARSRTACWAIENPVGRLSRVWGKPTHTFHPHEYAGYLPDPSDEAYTKRTCLWTGSRFNMPAKRPVAPVLGSRMHVLPNSTNRAYLRSLTPGGFAVAVWEANHAHT